MTWREWLHHLLLSDSDSMSEPDSCDSGCEDDDEYVKEQRLQMLRACHAHIRKIASDEADHIQTCALELAFIMSWQVMMYAMDESYQHFHNDPRLVKLFGAACLSISCKFNQSTDKQLIRCIRRNVQPENFLAMEVAVLNCFDWSLEQIESPTLIGLLHMSGCLDTLTKEQLSTLDNSILQVYSSSFMIESRMQDATTWAVACLEHAMLPKSCVDTAMNHMNITDKASVAAVLHQLQKSVILVSENFKI